MRNLVKKSHVVLPKIVENLSIADSELSDPDNVMDGGGIWI